MSSNSRTEGRKKYSTVRESNEIEEQELYLIGKGTPAQIWTFTSVNKGESVELVTVYSEESSAQAMVEQLAEKHYRLVPLMMSEIAIQVMNKNILFILNMQAIVRGW